MREADEKIIDRILEGELDAYRLLVDKYKDRVYSLVMGIVRQHELAEEVAQDVFVSAYKALRKFRKASSFSTWLYRIAYNRAITETRKRNYRYHTFEDQLEKAASLNEMEEDKVMDEGQKKLLEQALDQLPSEDKLIIMLYYFEEHSVEEISKSAGISVSNVKVRLFRLRNKLRDILSRMGMRELVVY